MKKILILLIPIMILTGSCEKFLDVNKNTDAPDKVEAYLYLAGVQQQFQGIYWDIRALGPLTQMMGTSGFGNFAINYYYPGSDNGGEIWRMVYWLQGMNLENLINQSEASEQFTLAGIGYAMKAFSWDLLTKVHGEVPMKQAYVPGLLSHDYDYQDEVFKQVRDWAYKAIELLEKQDATNYGSKITENDYIYGGDKSKWIKFAYAVIARNLTALTNKNNFSSDYAEELITAVNNSFQSTADDATLRVAGGSQSAPLSAFNNFWGTARGNLSRTYFQHEYAVQVFTGTVPEYLESTGNKISDTVNSYYPYVLADKQIITDSAIDLLGHFDPRVVVKLGTTSNPNYLELDDEENIKSYKFYGGTFTSVNGPIGTAPSFYGRLNTSQFQGAVHDGIGRWLYRDNAPYILLTYAELQFCLAETLWKLGRTGDAFNAFKKGIAADMEFSSKYITPGKPESPTGGDKISRALFDRLASEYLAGPYVNNLDLADFSLSHIMMQKWVALYPWGASEAWTDMRKYHFDIEYTGEYPASGNGWNLSSLTMKSDNDADKVYKGLYLAPAQVQGRRGKYEDVNEGSPAYRIRPRYNSEYMWNLKSLEVLRPISGTAANYHTSIPWFAYPGNMPQ